LCASCIASLASSTEVQERRRWPIIPTIQLSASVFVLWIVFFMVGQALLSIPSAFHDFDSKVFLNDEASDTEVDSSTPVNDGAP
jgi:hypothetical protein